MDVIGVIGRNGFPHPACDGRFVEFLVPNLKFINFTEIRQGAVTGAAEYKRLKINGYCFARAAVPKDAVQVYFH